jgi:HD-like signal output (HDOD) protein
MQTTHAEVGAYLLGLWGFRDDLIEAVAYHHRPGDCIATRFTPLTAVHVADAFELLLSQRKRIVAAP